MAGDPAGATEAIALHSGKGENMQQAVLTCTEKVSTVQWTPKEEGCMKRDEVLNILADHRDELRQQFGVKSLALFGSVARNEATETSDVDLLVAFARPVGLFGLYALPDSLGQLLGYTVDVGTLASLKPRIRARVLAESIEVS